MKEERENKTVELWVKGEEGEWLPCHGRFGGEEEEPWTTLSFWVLLVGLASWASKGNKKKKGKRGKDD